MADAPQTYTDIANAYAQAFPDRIVRQVNRMALLLAALPIVAGAGKNVAWDVEADGAIGENFTDGAAAANFGSDALAPATLNWGLYRSNFKITNLAAAVAASSSSPGQGRDLVLRGISNGVRKLASTLNGVGYSGAGTGTTIAGLHGIAIDSAGTYAGINRATGGNEYWQSYEIDASSAALSFAQIRTDLGAIYDACGMTPDIALCSTAVFNKVRGLFDASMKFDRQVTTARGSFTLDNSPEVIVMDGCQFVRDKDATASAILYLNSNEVAWEALQAEKSFADRMMPTGDSSVDALLGAMYAYELGRAGAARLMTVETQIQLKVMRPNACGKRINIG